MVRHVIIRCNKCLFMTKLLLAAFEINDRVNLVSRALMKAPSVKAWQPNLAADLINSEAI